MAKCGCTGACNCTVQGLDSDTIHTSVTGNGSSGAPYVVSAEAILVPDGEGPLAGEENALKSDALGLYIDPAMLGGGGGGEAVDPHTATATSSGLDTGTLYTAGDQMGDLMELTDMAADTGGAGVLGSLVLTIDKIGVVSSARAWLFSEPVTLAANNAAFALSDADILKCVGTVIFPAPADAANAAIATATPVGLDYDCVATSLYVALQTLVTHTVNFDAADDLHVTARAVRLS